MNREGSILCSQKVRKMKRFPGKDAQEMYSWKDGDDSWQQQQEQSLWIV